MLHILGIVEVNGADLYVRMEGVLVEKNSASGVMGHVKKSLQVIVLKVLNCLLQSNDVPFLRDVLFDGAFFASSSSRVPAQNAEACLLKQWLGTSLIKRYSGLGELCLRSWESR